MQLFVRTLYGSTRQVEFEPHMNLRDLQERIRALDGQPPAPSRLVYGGRTLQHGRQLSSYGVERDSTVHLIGYLRGGSPVKVKIITDHLACGQEVTIDIEPEAGKDEVKHKLEAVTGVPAEHQKVMLAGIGQLVMADKRTNIQFGSCGQTGGMQLAVMSTGKS
ncbi:hypothetical protein WJX72_009683 [[Myrmecia] bisecta]|uniref:Ubiquitin-like domain-containing protein n=1 Tax=[Myrmecia] bisecta TaxID=41462 RepID=A0AAW1R974_9CHLO